MNKNSYEVTTQVRGIAPNQYDNAIVDIFLDNPNDDALLTVHAYPCLLSVECKDLLSERVKVIVDETTTYVISIFLDSQGGESLVYDHDDEVLDMMKFIVDVPSGKDGTFQELQQGYLAFIHENPDTLRNFEEDFARLSSSVLEVIGIERRMQPFSISDINDLYYAQTVYQTSKTGIMLDAYMSEEDTARLNRIYYDYLQMVQYVSKDDGLYSRESFIDHTRMLMNY